ncbi:MAG: hypothetical protein Q7J47_12975 [Azoarcus sp.]|nr:hypothetical protein [Azoarcus sp.]
MNAALDTLFAGLNTALRNHIQPHDGLFDTLENSPSPSDHYGHVCAALALACGEEDDWNIGRQALEAWLRLDASRLGHLPFNRLALLLLRTVLGTRGLAGSDETLIDAGLRRCTLRRSYPSNNWSLLAQTCRLIEAPAAHKATESRRLCDLLQRWTTPKGCFIDFPKNPGTRFSTPLAYHHKALFLTALSCWYHDDTELTLHAQRLLDWLVHCWDPAGYAGGFGRSSHSLFGDGSLIAGLILIGIKDDDENQPIAALSHRLAHQRRDDGFLWLNPAGLESGAASWDSYMHLSVYNAWAAAAIGAAMHLRRTQIAPTSCSATKWVAARSGLFHDEAAGLLYLRNDEGLNALISTRGQPPQSYSSQEADFRYGGASIIHLRIGTGPARVPPPVRVTRNALAKTPALAGWTPLLAADDEILALDEFETIAIDLDNRCLSIRLEGSAKFVFRPHPSGVTQRILAALDWRLLGGRLGRNAALHRNTPKHILARICLEITSERGGVTISRKVEIRSSKKITYLNPQGYSLIVPTHSAAPLLSNAATAFNLSASLTGGRAISLFSSDIRSADYVSQSELHISAPSSNEQA